MRVLLDVSHPKDINVFKNVIISLQEKGHDIKLVARAKENTRKIIQEQGFSAEYGPHYSKIIKKLICIPYIDYWLLKVSRAYKPDIFVSFGSPYSAHVSRIMRRPHVAFIDTEIANFAINLMLPFTDVVYTSKSFTLDLGKKQKRFDSYLELAYLAPDYFVPDVSVLQKYSLQEKGYILLRLSALSSHHDINAQGFSFNSESELKDYIDKLEEYGQVIIFSEEKSWKLIDGYSLMIDPKDFHHILYYSKMCIGEGATMASEAAILGVPSIYVSNTRRGYLDELEQKYDLCYTLINKDEAIKKAVSIIDDKDHQMQWDKKRKSMLDEKVDLIKYIVNAIEKQV
jgi:predicted glycosyltransferase